MALLRLPFVVFVSCLNAGLAIAQAPAASLAGVSLEWAGAFAANESVGFDSMKRAGALLLGAETIIGPVYFGVGKTWHGSSTVYLFVGQP